jgi:glycosyltransferase involved in cell wall biosynthesis
MKVLWVTPHKPARDGSGGATAEYELLRSAAQRHDIHVLAAQLPPGEVEFDLGDRSVPMSGLAWNPRHPLFKADTQLKFLLHLLRATPTYEQWMLEPRLHAMRTAIQFHERRRPVDLVHFIGPELAPLARSCQAPTAMVTFDVLSRFCQQERRLADGVSGRARWAWERWERRWFPRFDGLAGVSSVDAAAIERLTGERPAVIPLAIPETYHASPAVPRSQRTVALVAFLSWRPNVDAVLWFAGEIWPRVIAAVPDAVLDVVGGKPDPAVARAVAAAGGRLYPDVPDVRPYYWSAAAAVSPIRLGSGMRSKVIHAMACGAPLVATSTSLEGIDAIAGRHLLVADDTAAFADAVISTLLDPTAAATRAQAARAFTDRYRADVVGASFEAFWQDTVTATGRRPVGRSREGAHHAHPLDKSLTTSVVVCTRDRPDLLRKTLPALAKSVETGRATELIIVEQASRYAADLCADLAIDATVVRDDGVGASRARNVGARHARGDIVLFTDDDCIVPGNWVVEHASAFEDDDEVTATFGALEGISRFAHANDVGTTSDDPAAHRAKHWAGTAPWFVGHSGNMAVRRDAFVAIGGFDERLGPGTPGSFMAEDADLIVRMLHEGGAALSGVGDPVRHLDWRSDDENRRNLLSYERGAGAWIGKVLRTEPRVGWRYLRARRELVRERLYFSGVVFDWRAVFGFRVGFGRGLARGFRLGGRKPPKQTSH